MRTLSEPSRSGDGTPEEPALVLAASSEPVPAAAAAPAGLSGFLADLLGRICRGIKGMVPLVFAAGCQSPPAAPAAPPPAAVVEAPEKASAAASPDAAPVEEGPRELGKFKITFYYIVGEEEMIAQASRKKPPANDNRRVAAGESGGSGSAIGSASGTEAPAEGSAGDPGGKDLAAATPPETVTLYGPAPECEVIAETTREFMFEVMMQGTGRLRDGRLVNLWGRCNCSNHPCFHIIKEQHWGLTGTSRPLQPFRTVAVDPRLIKLGSLLYVPMLEGRTMPGRAPWGGFVHDGCVVADDTGGAVRNYHLDLFVGRRAWFLGVSDRPGRHSWAHQVPVFDGSKICERKGRQVSRKSGSI
jgi:3D (Asp-Asp-Asp) domain-containing protein